MSSFDEYGSLKAFFEAWEDMEFRKLLSFWNPCRPKFGRLLCGAALEAKKILQKYLPLMVLEKAVKFHGKVMKFHGKVMKKNFLFRKNRNKKC